MRRTIALVVGLMTLLALTAAPTAAAGKPERVFLPLDPVEFASGDVCDFPLRQAPVDNREYGLFFPVAADGSQLLHISGHLTLRLTNLETGATLDLNASGPGKLTFLADGSLVIRAMGRATFWFLAGDADGPSYHLTTGLAVATIDPNGVETLALLPQHSPDLCAALAG